MRDGDENKVTVGLGPELLVDLVKATDGWLLRKGPA